jgi:uncharacterized damage-inducible protein DinB
LAEELIILFKVCKIVIDHYSHGMQLMSLLKPDELWKPVSRINNDRIRRTTNVKDVLIHVMTEELHHRGELIAILWQINIQPPDMGWLSVMKKQILFGY